MKHRDDPLEPFIFKLIQEHLPHEEEFAEESSPLSDRLVYLLIILVGLAALVFGYLFGVLRE